MITQDQFSEMQIELSDWRGQSRTNMRWKDLICAFRRSVMTQGQEDQLPRSSGRHYCRMIGLVLLLVNPRG